MKIRMNEMEKWDGFQNNNNKNIKKLKQLEDNIRR